MYSLLIMIFFALSFVILYQNIQYKKFKCYWFFKNIACQQCVNKIKDVSFALMQQKTCILKFADKLKKQ